MRDFHLPGRSATYAANGMCATSHPLAAKVAIDILQGSGNAADAAIAGAVLLGICEPRDDRDRRRLLVLLKPRGVKRHPRPERVWPRAQAALSADELRAKGLQKMPIRGIEAVTLPGAIDAFCRLNADWVRWG